MHLWWAVVLDHSIFLFNRSYPNRSQTSYIPSPLRCARHKSTDFAEVFEPLYSLGQVDVADASQPSQGSVLLLALLYHGSPHLCHSL